MSNQQVGTVYQQIISDVVESSRVDFEEGGGFVEETGDGDVVHKQRNQANDSGLAPVCLMNDSSDGSDTERHTSGR